MLSLESKKLCLTLRLTDASRKVYEVRHIVLGMGSREDEPKAILAVAAELASAFVLASASVQDCLRWAGLAPTVRQQDKSVGWACCRLVSFTWWSVALLLVSSRAMLMLLLTITG